MRTAKECFDYEADRAAELNALLGRIHVGDCLQTLAELPEDSIDLVVTSPPYDGIRDYKGFRLHLLEVGTKLFRAVKPGGVVVMAMQDGTKGCKSLTTFRTVITWCMNGWRLFECCIYGRHGTEGAYWTRRFRVDHEYLPVFVKGKRPAFFDKEPLKVPSKHAGKRFSGTRRQTDGSTVPYSEGVVNPTKCRGTVWDYPTGNDGPRLKHAHPATMPDRLAEDLIRCFCPPGGVVLDPFMGSGTTARAAVRLGRRWLGCEISEEYTREIAEPLIRLELEKVNLRSNPSDPLNGCVKPLRQAQETAVSELPDSDYGPCPNCGERIYDCALSCPHCKADFLEGVGKPKRRPDLPPYPWTMEVAGVGDLPPDPCPVCGRPIGVTVLTCPHCRCVLFKFRQAGLSKGKTSLEPSWVWNGSVADFVRSRIRGRSLNVCAGLSGLGDVRVDLDPKDRSAIRGDMSDLPFPDNSFDTVICDPPWRIGYHQRWKPFFELVRVCKVGGRIIHNAYWLPDSALVRLVETAVRVDSAFTNASVIAVFEKVRATR